MPTTNNNKRSKRTGSQMANKRLKATLDRLNENVDDLPTGAVPPSMIKSESSSAASGPIVVPKLLPAKPEVESESSNDGLSSVFDASNIGTKPVKAVLPSPSAQVDSPQQNGVDDFT